MDNDLFSLPMDASCQNPIIEDGKYTRPTSVSLVQANSHYMNNQHQVMAEFPALFMTQGEFLNHLHWDPHLQNHAEIPICTAMAPKTLQLERGPDKNILIGRSCPTSNIENRDLHIPEMPNSVDSHATLLSSKSGSGEKLYGKEILTPSACAQDVQETFGSSDCFDTLRHSLVTYRNHGDEGRPDNIRSNKHLHDIVAPHIAGTVHQRPLLEPFKIMGNMDQNWWISAENTSMSSYNTSGSSIYSSERSPSQSISQPAVICATAIAEHCSEIRGSGLCDSSLPGGRISSEHASCSINNLSLNCGYKPVQRSNLFSGSRFLRELQEILAELASYSFGNSGHISYFASGTSATVNFSRSSDQPAERSHKAAGPDRFSDGDCIMVRGQEAETRKSLLNLLQVVDNQYSRCLDEIHKVISAFHAVTELDPRIHAHFALQTVDLLYKNLRERISNSVLALGTCLHEGGGNEGERSFETSFIQKQWALQQLRKKDHQLWRPQRGLPERSVSVLRAWMFQNFLHPYPKDAEKHLLAVKSGLTRSQVSNWFINARVRIWKPMIDEMYSEMNMGKARQNAEETDRQRSLISINSNRFRMN